MRKADSLYVKSSTEKSFVTAVTPLTAHTEPNMVYNTQERGEKLQCFTTTVNNNSNNRDAFTKPSAFSKGEHVRSISRNVKDSPQEESGVFEETWTLHRNDMLLAHFTHVSFNQAAKAKKHPTVLHIKNFNSADNAENRKDVVIKNNPCQWQLYL